MICKSVATEVVFGQAKVHDHSAHCAIENEYTSTSCFAEGCERVLVGEGRQIHDFMDFYLLCFR